MQNTGQHTKERGHGEKDKGASHACDKCCKEDHPAIPVSSALFYNHPISVWAINRTKLVTRNISTFPEKNTRKIFVIPGGSRNFLLQFVWGFKDENPDIIKD
jgi:hypothetical protein